MPRHDASGSDARLLATLRAILPADIDASALEPADGETPWACARRVMRLDDAGLVARLSARYGVTPARLGSLDASLREAIPEALARRLRVVPLRATGSALIVATSCPDDHHADRAIFEATKRRVRFAAASPNAIAVALDTIYGASRPARDEGHALGGDDRPVVRLVDEVMAAGVTRGASDIHLECGESGVAVRYRIDGVLRDAMTLPRETGIPVVSRIKIMSGLDIADRLRPQDGRTRVAVGGRSLDLRVSTLPAAHGEKVVIRVLDAGATLLSLDALGLGDDDAARLDAMLDAREGIVLVTGPTGSGKTTTLYAALRHVQKRGVNVVTVEDPVEYRLPGIAQVQVNERAGMTFAAALRSILRQDPDVVLVGEIRDRETATVAVQASLTGHLVLSTLHTIDAAGAVTRLSDLGVEPFKLAAALRGVVAQRLVRKRCAVCRGDEPPNGTVPCVTCGGSGYRGRAAVVELLTSDAEVARTIARGGTAAQVADAARLGGMRTLWESALDQVRRGLTDMPEVLRCLEAPTPIGPLLPAVRLAGLPDFDDCFSILP
jgi:general secretion pathway protein E